MIHQISVFSVDMTVKSEANNSSGGFSWTVPKPLEDKENLAVMSFFLDNDF